MAAEDAGGMPGFARWLDGAVEAAGAGLRAAADRLDPTAVFAAIDPLAAPPLRVLAALLAGIDPAVLPAWRGLAAAGVWLDGAAGLRAVGDRLTAAPTAVWVGVICLAVLLAVGRMLRRRRDAPPRLRGASLAALGLLSANYLWWRLTATVLPANDLSLQSAFVWTLFAIELLTWFDMAVFFLILWRQTDRSPEADGHEARLRAADPAALPTVDVFIATYNEPLPVLEKSIVGATGLDWPADRLRVWVLDDGRRPWLEAFARRHGAGYLTRPDNSHAKAGNINAALARTEGDFVLVLDADFVPRRDFLYRTVGFFEDPRIGIVQTPHHFFNPDPLQAGMALQSRLPDEQRLFFDVVMPGRDGWDCAFCCGSNGIIRRAALDEAGGRLPTSSVTEDILLTLVLLRRGYLTRYLSERLATGLAPESLEAYFVQRARWARGGVQTVFLRQGPLGPGLRPIQRLLFLPTHWLTQPLMYAAAILVPAIYLLTGLRPLLNAGVWDILLLQVPAIAGGIAATHQFARGRFLPLPAAIHAVMQATRLLPVVLATLVRPFGHAFKVTPKGSLAASGAVVDRPTLRFALIVLGLTWVGLVLNARPETRIITESPLSPVVAFWAVVNMLILGVVARTAVQTPRKRGEERFALRLPCLIETEHAAWVGETRDLSLTGAALESAEARLAPGDWVVLTLPDIGRIAGRVARATDRRDGGASCGVRLHLPDSAERVALIRRLYAAPGGEAPPSPPGLPVTLAMLARVFLREPAQPPAEAALPAPPAWVHAILADRAPTPQDPLKAAG